MSSMILVGVLMVLMVGFMIYSGRKQKQMMQDRYDMLGKLLPGDRVVTTSGMYATIVAVRETEVDLMVGDGVITTWDLNALRGKAPEAPSAEESEMEANATATDTDDELAGTIIPDNIEELDGDVSAQGVDGDGVSGSADDKDSDK